MSDLARHRDEQCVQALRDYLDGGGERALRAACELGREALESGLGVLDLTAMLQRALAQVEQGNGRHPRLREQVVPFVLECYSPYELAHRGARQANLALRRINETREEEIRRLAHELREESDQALAAVHHALDAVAGDMSSAARAGLDLVRERLGEMEAHLRRISHDMRPSTLDDLGLVPALRFLGEGISGRHGLAVQVEAPTHGRLPAAVETALYRVAQDALTNVVQHGRASRVTLRVERAEGQVVMSIADDGIGFDGSDMDHPGGRMGLGITGIRARVAPLGGTVEIRSAPQGGTELVIPIPILSLDLPPTPPRVPARSAGH